MINRAFKYCKNDILLECELDHLREIFIANNYPATFINKAIENWRSKYNNALPSSNSFDNSKSISIPYYDGLGYAIKKVFADCGINTVFKSFDCKLWLNY